MQCGASRCLCDADRFTARYFRAVVQDVSPGMCVLLSTSKSVRRAVKLWETSGDGKFWKVQLDIRDLGRRVGEATIGVAAVVGFQVKVGLARG